MKLTTQFIPSSAILFLKCFSNRVFPPPLPILLVLPSHAQPFHPSALPTMKTAQGSSSISSFPQATLSCTWDCFPVSESASPFSLWGPYSSSEVHLEHDPLCASFPTPLRLVVLRRGRCVCRGALRYGEAFHIARVFGNHCPCRPWVSPLFALSSSTLHIQFSTVCLHWWTMCFLRVTSRCPRSTALSSCSLNALAVFPTYDIPETRQRFLLRETGQNGPVGLSSFSLTNANTKQSLPTSIDGTEKGLAHHNLSLNDSLHRGR